MIDRIDAAATYTLMGAGVLRHDDPRNLGLIGMHGSMAANHAIDQADLVIALGTRFSDRVALNPNRFAQRAAIVHVDIDESEINKNVFINYDVVADIKDFLQAILPKIEQKSNPNGSNTFHGSANLSMWMSKKPRSVRKILSKQYAI